MSFGVLRLHNPMVIVVWLTLFLPESFFQGWAGIFFQAAVGLLGGVTLFCKPSLWETRRPARQAAMFFFLIQLLYVISYFYSVGFNGVRTGLLDHLELARYLFAGLFAVYLIRHHDAQVAKALESALAAALYISLFIEVPAHLGYLSTVTLCYFLFFSRARLRLAHAAAAALVVFFAGGRMAWVASAFAVSVALEAWLHRRPARGLMRKYPVLLSAGLFLALLTPLMLARPTEVGAPQPGITAAEAFKYIRRSPLFGWGPAAYEPIASVANQYLQWVLRQGILGTGLVLAGLGLVAWRLLRAVWEDRRRRAGAAVFLGAVAMLLMSGAFLTDFRLFSLTAFLIAGMHEESR